MGTRVKGFFKGLKNISNIFGIVDEEEEPEIQIGMPTDVKHVAHIGADGPATESPSWMNGFNAGRSQSGPMENSGTNEGIKNHRSTRSEVLTRDISEASKTSRHRRRSMDNSSDSDSQSSTRSNPRRHRIRRSREKGNLPDIPKRSRRKNSKDDDGSTKSRDSESSSHEPHLDH